MQRARSVFSGRLATAVLLFLGAPATMAADDGEPRIGPAYPVVELAEVLDAVARRSGKTFIVDAQVDGHIQIGQLKVRDIDLAELHSVLFVNRLAAVDVGGLLQVVPADRVRQQALPLVNDGVREFAKDEWVTRLVPLDNMRPIGLVPTMRPLLPREAHMVADPQSSTILIVGRYANVARLTEVIEQLDARAEQAAADE